MCALRACFFGFFTYKFHVKLLFSAVSLSPFFLIALALQCVHLDLKKIMPAQTGLPRRATAGVGAAAHSARITSVH
jgi:hypothetical protein